MYQWKLLCSLWSTLGLWLSIAVCQNCWLRVRNVTGGWTCRFSVGQSAGGFGLWWRRYFRNFRQVKEALSLPVASLHPLGESIVSLVVRLNAKLSTSTQYTPRGMNRTTGEWHGLWFLTRSLLISGHMFDYITDFILLREAIYFQSKTVNRDWILNNIKRKYLELLIFRPCFLIYVVKFKVLGPPHV